MPALARALHPVAVVMSRTASLPLGLAFVLFLATPKCVREHRSEAQLDPERSAPATITSADLGSIVTVDVPNDLDVLVVPGNASVRRPIVHLHGMCGDPRDDLRQYGTSVAAEHGTIIAVMGDVPCLDKPGRLKWSDDTSKHDARILGAISAVNAARALTLDTDDVVLVGESMGAARAEMLAAANPRRYPRLVLVGSPQTPSPARLKGVRAIANIAGEREEQTMMREGARRLSSAGAAAQFWELPGATHGDYGPEGARVMSEALAFVAAR